MSYDGRSLVANTGALSQGLLAGQQFSLNRQQSLLSKAQNDRAERQLTAEEQYREALAQKELAEAEKYRQQAQKDAQLQAATQSYFGGGGAGLSAVGQQSTPALSQSPAIPAGGNGIPSEPLPGLGGSLQQQPSLSQAAAIPQQPQPQAQAGNSDALWKIATLDPDFATKILKFSGAQNEQQAQQYRGYVDQIYFAPADQKAAAIEAAEQAALANGAPAQQVQQIRALKATPPEQIQQTLGALRYGLLPQNEKTSVTKNAEASGLIPGTPEWNDFVAGKTGNQVSVNLPQQDEYHARFQRTQADKDVNRLDELTAAAERGNQVLTSVNQLEAMADSGQLKTGPLEGGKSYISSIATNLGVPEEISNKYISNAGAYQTAEALISQMVTETLRLNKGQQTNFDYQKEEAVYASLKNTPAGFKYQLERMKARAYLSQEQANFYAERMQSSTDPKTYAQAQKEWTAYIKQNPIMSKTLKSSAGTPMYYTQFADQAKQYDPEITDDAIKEQWRELNGIQSTATK